MHSPFSTISTTVKKRRPHRPYRSARRHFNGRECAAVVRAFTAAGLYLDGKVPTITKAALCCGSNHDYVAAAIVLIRAEDQGAISRVLHGHARLLEEARAKKPVANLVTAYRRVATSADYAAFARAVGPAHLFDNAVVAAL